MFPNELLKRFLRAMKRERDFNYNFGTIEFLHNKVHEGGMFFVSHVFRDVPNGGVRYIRHVTGSEKYLHSEVLVNTTGQWDFISYAGTTYTANGTELDILNRKSDSTEVAGSVFYHTPTINVLGTPRLEFIFGAGENPVQASSGQFSERLESMFAPNADVLIALRNESGAARDLAVTFNFYEE